MSASPISRRISIGLYRETQKKLQSLEKELARSGVRADRTDIIRALIHGTPEKEIVGVGFLCDQHERGPEGRYLGLCAEIAPIRMPPADYGKLEKAAGRLAKAGVKASVSVLIRGLVMAPLPLDRLAGMVEQYRRSYPDGRNLRWNPR